MTTLSANAERISRRIFVQHLMDAIPAALVVTGLGSSSYDVFAAGDRDGNFYLWGGMGGAVPVGLGLAIAQPERSVVVVTGDGEMLMGLGSLASVGVQAPPNLTVVVLDNGHFGETGMQPSHTSLGVSLAAVAVGCGVANSRQIDSYDGLADLVGSISARTQTTFYQVLVAADEPPRALPPRDGAYVKDRFRACLGFGSI